MAGLITSSPCGKSTKTKRTKARILFGEKTFNVIKCLEKLRLDTKEKVCGRFIFLNCVSSGEVATGETDKSCSSTLERNRNRTPVAFMTEGGKQDDNTYGLNNVTGLSKTSGPIQVRTTVQFPRGLFRSIFLSSPFYCPIIKIVSSISLVSSLL